MGKLKRIAAVLLVAVLAVAMSVTASAHTVPDVNKIGSITVAQQDGGETVTGGSYTLYRVGDIHVDDGNYSFALTKSFAGSQLKLTDIASAKLAKNLADYAQCHDVNGVTYRVGKGGVVYFEKLKPGLYLLMQEEAATGYNKADPFLVTVPIESEEGYLYDVDSSPKMELEKAPDTPPNTPPHDSNLPQTGQLNWPIPVLAIGGLVFFAAGWILILSRKRGKHES